MKKRSSIENTPLGVFLVLLLLVTLAPAARAGIANSPVPDLTSGGAKTLVVYSVPAVMNNYIGTYFLCTSTSTASQQVAVEVFDASGTSVSNAVATQLTLAPGAAVIFGTENAAGILEDQFLGGPGMSKGSARILSTSSKLICTAFLAETGSNPPASMVYLTIVAKTKQKGE